MCVRFRLLATVVLAMAIASCGGASVATQPSACDPTTGCVRVDRISGTCQCLEWELVSIEPVPVKYVVVGIVYAALGNESQVSYGYTTPVASIPPASSQFGSRWRSLVRSADGSESVAALGPISVGSGTWGPLTPVTMSSGALIQPLNEALGVQSTLDVNSHEGDQIFVWLNPAAAVTTNYIGEKTVAWSTKVSHGVGGALVMPFYAGWLDGAIPMPSNVQDLLTGLDASDLAAILKRDPFFEPPGRDPATIGSDPRFRRLETVFIDPNHLGSASAAWTPCAETLTDATFPVLAEEEIAFGARETFVLQHSFLTANAVCTPQQPGLVLGTITPACSISADVLVDTMFGTLLTLPTSVTPSCTGP